MLRDRETSSAVACRAAAGWERGHSRNTHAPHPTTELFLEADADGSGYLDRREFQTVLNAGEFKLSKREINAILAEVDENDDGVIEYREFVPIMVDLLQAIKARHETSAAMDSMEDELRGQVEDMLLHGVPKQELEEVMLKVRRGGGQQRGRSGGTGHAFAGCRIVESYARKLVPRVLETHPGVPPPCPHASRARNAAACSYLQHSTASK